MLFSIYNRPEGDNSLTDIDYIGHSRDGGCAIIQLVRVRVPHAD